MVQKAAPVVDGPSGDYANAMALGPQELQKLEGAFDAAWDCVASELHGHAEEVSKARRELAKVILAIPATNCSVEELKNRALEIFHRKSSRFAAANGASSQGRASANSKRGATA